MEIISGRKIADEIQLALKSGNRVKELAPCLAVIDVGEFKDNEVYINLKRKAVESIGGTTRIVKLKAQASRAEVLEIIRYLNQDDSVDGILLQLPLPAHLDAERDLFLEAIAGEKDVDGFSPCNRGRLMGNQPEFVSCAALACLDVCRRYLGSLAGKKALLVGNSFDVVQSLALLLIKEGCSVCIEPEYKPEALTGADIAVIEAGTPLMIGSKDLNSKILMIDAGFHWFQDKACGNIDREAVAAQEGYLLPVPGGLGPLLIAHLMVNLSRAAGRKK